MKNAVSLFAAIAMLCGSATLYAADAASGKGTLNRVDAANGTVNISHEAIPALKWPAMTMDFKLADKKVASGVKPGQAVSFGLVKDAHAGYVISHIEAVK